MSCCTVVLRFSLANRDSLLVVFPGGAVPFVRVRFLGPRLSDALVMAVGRSFQHWVRGSRDGNSAPMAKGAPSRDLRAMPRREPFAPMGSTGSPTALPREDGGGSTNGIAPSPLMPFVFTCQRELTSVQRVTDVVARPNALWLVEAGFSGLNVWDHSTPKVCLLHRPSETLSHPPPARSTRSLTLDFRDARRLR